MKWLRFYISLWFVGLLSVDGLYGQEGVKEDVSAVIARILEQIVADEENVFDMESVEEDLLYFSQHPINLNSATKEELDRLQFLSDKQVENLLYYLYRHKMLQTIYELQLVDGFDMFVIRNLLPFVYVGESQTHKEVFPSWKNIWRYGKSDFVLRVDKTLEQKQGYRNLEDNKAAELKDERYLGSSYYGLLKYQFRYRDKIEMGVVAEKDAGEQFWGSYQKGFDFYSGYLQLNKVGLFKTIVVGNFSPSFGLGLVVHPEMNISKSTSVLNVLPKNAGLRKNASSSEYNFFRGGGVTFVCGRADISVFYSYRFMDGDSTGSSLSSIKTDGLHRLASRMRQKNVTSMQILGGNITFRATNFWVGATVADTRLGSYLNPPIRPDNLFYFRGNHQLAVGLNYRVQLKKMTFFGEQALCNSGGIAFLNGFAISPVSRVNLLALHRYYSRKYDALLANSFSEGVKVNNEEGVYLGVEINPVSRWKVTAYSDVYAFPWLRYGVSRPSVGGDWMITAFFQQNKSVEMNWRIRHTRKERNLDLLSMTTYTGETQKSSLRYSLSYVLSGCITGRNVVELNRSKTDVDGFSYGVLLSQEVSCRFSKFPLAIDVRYEFFDANNYENRFYSYERDVLSVFSTPLLYGQGNRWYINCKYQLAKNIAFWLKVSQIYYENQLFVGSGLEQINSPHKTDIRGVVKVHF